jgi:hypothetical protein
VFIVILYVIQTGVGIHSFAPLMCGCITYLFDDFAFVLVCIVVLHVIKLGTFGGDNEFHGQAKKYVSILLLAAMVNHKSLTAIDVEHPLFRPLPFRIHHRVLNLHKAHL